MAHPTRRHALVGMCSTVLSGATYRDTALASPAPNRLECGVNLAGAEFGRMPGVHGREYSYPGRRHVAYFAELGLTIVRIPFRWERLQPALNAPFDGREIGRLAGLVETCRAFDLKVVLDPHNYARRYLVDDGWSTEHMIGSAAVPVDAYVDFWRRLAQRFGRDAAVWFGLMNEPYGISARDWLDIANAAIAGIRREGARNLVLVPGTNWSGAHSWSASGNEAMAETRDPAGNFAIEVHQYFDADSSGSSPVAVSGSIGSERVEAFEDWARSNRLRAFVGEFGFAANPAGLNAGRDLLTTLAASPDVWIGWAAWAAGPGWPDDGIFLLEPTRDGRMRPQTEVLQEAARRTGIDAWADKLAILDLDFMRNRAVGVLEPGDALSFDGSARSPLLRALANQDVTIVIEMRASPRSSPEMPVLIVNGSTWMKLTADGRLDSDLALGLQTSKRSPASSGMRRRLALSLSRSSRRASIAITGASGATVEGIAAGSVETMSVGAGLMGPRKSAPLIRIGVRARYAPLAELERIVA